VIKRVQKHVIKLAKGSENKLILELV